MTGEKQRSSIAPETAWDEVRGRFLATGDAAGALEARSALVDEAVLAAWRRILAPACPGGMALLAVGGYGRRDLFPYSDVDLLFLVETPPAGERKQALAEFLRVLWDEGLRLSHSVRTPKECCGLDDNNVELSISLIDQRLLAGDRALYETFRRRWPRFLHSRRQDLTDHLCRLARERHAKYHGTFQHLEPDVKETPGGLRDLHLLEWLERLHAGTEDAPRPAGELGPARSFLSAVRCFLHFRAGRDDNRLSFEAQEELARQSFVPAGGPAALMRRYYLHARAVHRVAERTIDAYEGRHSTLFRDFRRWRSRLSNNEFTVIRERIYFRSPAAIPHDPELVLRLFEFAARHGIEVSPDAERRIREHLPAIENYFSESRPHWVALARIFKLPHAPVALRGMHETGVLAALLPEWKNVECLVVRDFYHRYTVDEHTLAAVEALADLRRPQQGRRANFAGLLSESPEPELPALALLLHDLGKAAADGNHTRHSLEIADRALERIQLPLRKRSHVLFLIEHHLDLSAAVTSRDLDDQAVIRNLAQMAGTVERLKDLVLITYADVSAVNPSAMSPWRMERLWRLYLAVHQELTRELETDRIHSAGASGEQAAFLEGFPRRYLRVHSAEEVAAHLELARRAQQRGAAVRVERRNGVYEVTVAASDRPRLFASLAGALAGFGLNILEAEAFSNAAGLALDVFDVEDPNRNLELNPAEVERLEWTLERVATGRLRARDLLQARPSRRRRRGAGIEPRVTLDNSASETATLIEVVAEDRPGLLYQLARTLSEAGCNIEVVLVETRAGKAIDVIYVTREGRKLPGADGEALREALLEAAAGR